MAKRRPDMKRGILTRRRFLHAAAAGLVAAPAILKGISVEAGFNKPGSQKA